MHIQYKYMHYWLWVGRKEKKEMTSQHAEDKRWVFSSDSKREKRGICLTERVKESSSIRLRQSMEQRVIYTENLPC